MSDQKIKTAKGKVRMDLIPLKALQGAARVFEYGAQKYAKGNWYCATDDEFTERYTGAALRHLTDAQNDDGTFDMDSLANVDAESGQPQIDHIICGLIMLRGLLTKRGVLAADPGLAVTADPIRMQTTGPRYEVVPSKDVGSRPWTGVFTQKQALETIARAECGQDVYMSSRDNGWRSQTWPLAVVDNHGE